MNLHIDTSNSDAILIKLGDQEFTANSRERRSQYLLEFIDLKLKDAKKTKSDINSITVNNGPGSYTGLRVGVAVASTLGWALGVKVNNKDIKNSELVEINY